MYSKGQALEFIESVFGSGILSNAGANISVTCPFCVKEQGAEVVGTKKKLVIKTDNFFLHCWVCEYKSRNLVGILKKFFPNHLPKYYELFDDSDYVSSDFDISSDNIHIKENEELNLPEGFVLLAPYFNMKYIPNINVFKTIKYLISRGLTEKDLWYFKLGISTKDFKFKDRVIFPSFDKTGKLNYYTARTILGFKKHKKKFLNPNIPKEKVIFNELNINWKEPLTLVEGPFDLTKSNENTVPLLGSTFNEDFILFQKIIENNTPVILALDNDAKKKTKKIAALLHSYGINVKIFKIPEKYNDVGEMTAIDFIKHLPDAVEYGSSLVEEIKFLLES